MTVERTLHHFPHDPASRQVRLALGEKRLPFTEVIVPALVIVFAWPSTSRMPAAPVDEVDVPPDTVLAASTVIAIGPLDPPPALLAKMPLAPAPLALTLLPVMFTITPAAVPILPAALWAKMP